MTTISQSPSPSRFLLVVVAVSVVVFSSITFAIHYTAWPEVDMRVATAMRADAQTNRVMRGFFVMVTDLGSVMVLGVLATIGVFWSCAVGQFRLAAVWLAVVVSGAILNVVVKGVVDRDRPPHEIRDRAVEEYTLSYPSGHSMGSAIGYGMLGFALFGPLRTPTRRIVVESLLFVLVLLIGYSRIYLRAHWLSDVAAGLVLGTGWLIGWLWLFVRFRVKDGRFQ